jgi:DNA-binding response OmpR family regulator
MDTKKVLLINDDADFKFLFKAYLERNGFLAQAIDITDDVIPFVEKFEPQVIVVDIKLESDKKICAQLKEKAKIQAKIVLLTDKGVGPADLPECKPDIVLQKPFEPEELIDKIAMA